MKDEIEIFENPEFGEIRTTADAEGEPLFCAADVCRALGYAKPQNAVAHHVDEGDALKRGILTAGGEQQMTFVNESGLYALIFGSTLPTAKQFKRWVTSDLLPTYRKHGAVMSTETIERSLADPDYLISLATIIKDERARRVQAEADAAAKRALIAQRDAKIEADRPKVEFADTVQCAEGDYSFGEVAKILNKDKATFPNGIGSKRLFQKLRELDIIMHGSTLPYQRYVDSGYFRVGVVTTKAGFTTPVARVTQRGLRWLVYKLTGRGYAETTANELQLSYN